MSHLGCLLRDAARIRPDGAAVIPRDRAPWSYARLHHEASCVAARLHAWGIGRGDRVGLLLRKSPEAVAAIHGILAAGAAYVPVDAAAPLARSVEILGDCGVSAAIVASDILAPRFAEFSARSACPRLITVGDSSGDASSTSWDDVVDQPTPCVALDDSESTDLAYVLYTSGSTGRPKGVLLSHRNAFAFLDWCERHLELRDDDRFASHAPFHFDLSIFDLYASCRRAAPLVLIDEATGRDPNALRSWLLREPVSVWYSAPSILALLAESSPIKHDSFPAPRVVLFAGEVFPQRPLKRLRDLWPAATFWNLYGPTETNVCTAYRIPRWIPADRTEPYPIGFVCEPHEARVVGDSGTNVTRGTIGELLISGPGVAAGYHARPELTDGAFWRDERGVVWYRTGDLVSEDGDGCFQFHGRRDRMVKRRGYRIELGEIESALNRSGDLERSAVVATSGAGGVTITAFVALKEGQRASQIAVKRHCAEILPAYMIPDRVRFLSSLPSTSTDKVDYQSLQRIADHADEPMEARDPCCRA